jgi:hypothetical protein
MPGAHRLIVVGQELQLEEYKQSDRAYHETNLGDEPQEETCYSGADLA